MRIVRRLASLPGAWFDRVFPSNYEASRAARLSHAVSWSSLSSLGNSPIVKLTVIVPILGTILVFNESAASFLRLAQGYLSDIGVAEAQQNEYSLRQLYFLHFGLSAIGIGSLIFGLFCPALVKKHPDPLDHVTATELDKSPVIAKSNFEYVLNRYFQLHNEEGDPSPGARMEYPFELEVSFENLIREMFDAMPPDDLIATEDDQKTGFEYSEFYTGTGYPNIYNIARMVWRNPKVIWAFTQPFRGLAIQFSRDVAFVHYSSLDYSKSFARLSVAAMYAVGFALLAIPTVTTFVRLLWNLGF